MASNKKWSKIRRVSELMTRKNSKYHEIRQSLLSFNILGDLPRGFLIQSTLNWIMLYMEEPL